MGTVAVQDRNNPLIKKLQERAHNLINNYFGKDILIPKGSF